MSGSWRKGMLSEGIHLLSGQHIEANNYRSQPPGIPYLTGPADFPNGQIIVSKYTSEPKVVCLPGDILLTVKGSGTGQIVKANDSYCISRQLMAVRATKFDADFVFYVLDAHQERYSNAASGLIPGITREDVLNTPILIPPLPEQRKIAEILSTWDEAIAITERLIGALKQRKQALMQLLLTGQVRFPEFEGEWEEVQLGVHIDLLTGFAFKSEAYTDDSGIRLLRGINVTGGKLRWDFNITKYWETSAGFEKYLVEESDVIIAMDGNVGKNYARVENHDLPALLVQRVARLRAKAGLNQHYLFQQIADPRFIKHAEQLKTATAIAHISPHDIRSYTVGLPSVSEQEQIADALDLLDHETRLNVAGLEMLQTQKRGLMQRLLTGQVRVAVGDGA